MAFIRTNLISNFQLHIQFLLWIMRIMLVEFSVHVRDMRTLVSILCLNRNKDLSTLDTQDTMHLRLVDSIQQIRTMGDEIDNICIKESLLKNGTAISATL